MQLSVFTLPDSDEITSSIKFDPDDFDAVKSAFGYENVELYSTDVSSPWAESEMGYLGHPVFMPFTFNATSYVKQESTTDEQGNIRTTKVRNKMPDLFIPICVIEASQATQMEATAVEGRDGTIKEYASLGDYLINIKGILVSTDGKFPEKQMQDLVALRQASCAIPVTCELLRYLQVTALVIKNVKWTPMPGYENCQAFELECVSDSSEYLKLSKEQ